MWICLLSEILGGGLLPWRQFSLAVHAIVMWISLTPAGGTGASQSHAAFDWKPVWQLRDFSFWVLKETMFCLRYASSHLVQSAPGISA